MTKKILNLPEEGMTTKFVQINIRNEPYLICGEAGDCHSEILEKILKKFNLDFDTIETKCYELIPSLIGKNYEAVGMGKVKVLKNQITFFDFSGDYKIGPDKNYLEKIKPDLPKGMEARII